MPQIFQVLKCYKCMVFQVHQAKKSNKWVCKLCGEKQSIKRHYGLGTAKECRIHVQHLNKIKGEIDDLRADGEDSDDDIENAPSSICLKTKSIMETNKKISKWSSYVVEEAEETIDGLADNTMNGVKVVLDITHKRKRVAIPPKDLSLNVNLGDQTFVDTLPSCSTALSNCKNNKVVTKHTKQHDNVTYNIRETETKKFKQIVNDQISSSQLCPTIIAKRKIPSKWEQYVSHATDEHERGTNENEENIVAANRPNVGTLFSLCDDQDIDDLLSF